MALLDDLRLVLRALARAPGFALVSVLSVALGVGANVAVFGLVDALLLRPLPVPDADRVVRVGRSTRGTPFGTVSLPEYRELRDGAAPAAELVAHRPTNAIVTVRGEPRALWIELVSANYFSALRVRPFLGRGLGAAEDGPPGTGPAVVVSHGFWQRQLGGDPAAVGGTIRVNGRDFTVVGVAPPSFRGTFTGFALVPLQVAGTVLAVSGAAGLLLASLGVFGLVAYAVSQRVREIGIRVALGARRGAVTRLVAVQGLRPVLAGLALGLVVAAGAARLLRALLVGVGPSDPATLATVAAVLLLTAAAALVGPLRRALVVDPARVLRGE